MKVQKILEHFQTLDADADVCILWWERPTNEEWYGNVPSVEAWRKICSEFTDLDWVDTEITEWMGEAIQEYTEKG